MFLCIDTTTSEAGITLVGGGIFHQEIDPYQASETILKVIDGLIKEAGITTLDIEGVFVIKGPGSFTGLRVGISVANTFAHELNIPIVGLRTDEWWKVRTDETGFLYLQSMNKAEVYAVDKKGQKVLAISELSEYGEIKWLGELSEAHQGKLPENFNEITKLKSAEETWKAFSKADDSKYKSEIFIEPYYGKDPMITKSKKKLSIND